MAVFTVHLTCALMMTMVVVVLAQGPMPPVLRAPPNITNPRTPIEISHVKGSKFNVDCAASGEPLPSFVWYYGDKPVNSTGRVSSSGAQLKFSELTLDEVGNYTCWASNTFTALDGTPITPVSISPNVSIKLSFLKDWPTTEENRIVTGQQRGYFGLRCDSNRPDYSGSVVLTWYLWSTDSQGPVSLDNRMYIDQEGTLHFAYLTANDSSSAKGDFAYACALSNTDTGKIVSGTKLTVQVTVDSTDTSARLRYSSAMGQRLTFLKGSNATLECFFSGFPVPVIQWKDKNQANIEDGKYFKLKEDGRQMVILNVNESHETTFYCGVKDQPFGTFHALTVDVTSPPMWVERLESQTVLNDTDAVFNCKTESMKGERPPSRPIWKKNGKSFTTRRSQKYELSQDGQTLRVKNVVKDMDIACYQCSVSNSVGKTSGDGCLNVIEHINITSSPPSKQSIFRGDVVDLTVRAITDPLYVPELSYRWTFRNDIYNTMPPFAYRDNKVTNIDTSGLNTTEMRRIAGVYTCTVYHRFDSQNVTFEVKLRGPVVAAFPFWIIGVVFAVLLILIVIIICCCVICRRKMQEGDYPVDKKETAAGLDPEKEVKESAFPDLSRAQDPNQNSKPKTLELADESDRDDESFGGTEYGDDPIVAFNEDGSFIGQYQSKAKQPVPNPAFQSTHPGENHTFQPAQPVPQNAYQPQPKDNPAFSPNESCV